MNNKNKTRLAAMVMAALAVLGLSGAAVVQSAGTTSAPPAEQPESIAPADNDTLQVENGADDATEAPEANEAAEPAEAAGAEDQSPSYTSSITAPNVNPADDGTETADDETAEAQALAGLVTITSDQAMAAALAAVPGTVVQVELDNENGSVVYSVEVDTGNGIVDVKVDAGNGTILHQDADNDIESDG